MRDSEIEKQIINTAGVVEAGALPAEDVVTAEQPVEDLLLLSEKDKEEQLQEVEGLLSKAESYEVAALGGSPVFTADVNAQSAGGAAASGGGSAAATGSGFSIGGLSTGASLAVIGGGIVGTALVVDAVDDDDDDSETVVVNGGGGNTSQKFDATVNNVSVTEGDAGTKTMTFTITLSEAPTSAVTLNYSTADGTASSNSDYTPVSGTVTFAAGQTQATVSVDVLGDTLVEQDETLTLTVSGSNLNAPATGTGTIVNDDVTTFNLTTGADTSPTFDGTAGDDVYLAEAVGNPPAATLTGLDQLDGKGGSDTLNIVYQGLAVTNTSATVANIETANISTTLGVGAAGNSFNVSGWTGLTSANITKATDAYLTAAATTDVTTSGTTGLVDLDGGKDVTVTQTLAAATNSVAVDGAAGDVTVTATNSAAAGGGITLGANTANTGAVTVTASGNGGATAGGGAAALDAIAVTGGSSINVTQSVDAIANIATAGGAGDVVTQGAVTVTAGSNTTSVNVVQDDQVAAVAAQAAAGASQTQTVTFTALVAGNTVTVNGLTFTAAVNLTAEQVAQAFANLEAGGDRQTNGGTTANGTYSGVDAGGFTTGAANGNVVTYTETVNGTNAAPIAAAAAQGAGASAPTNPTVVTTNTGVADQAAVTGVAGVANGAVVIDDTAANTITEVTVDGYGAGATIGATGALDSITNLTLSNSGAGAATLHTGSTGALTLNLDDVDAAVNLDGTAATVTNLTINTSGAASTGAISAAAAQTVTINADAALSGASTYTAATLIDVNGSAAVNLTGATTNAATLQTIDASGNSGGVTAVLGNLNAVAFTGGMGADSLTLGAAAIAAGDNIDMGAGNDTLTVATGTTSATIAATVTGGAGTDTLSMGAADAVANSANTNFDAEVVGFERLLINDAVGGTVNLNNLSYNYVILSGGNVNLTNAAANTTVDFSGLAAQGGSLHTVALADATGNADAVNYVLASTNETSATGVADQVLGTANNGGTVTANGVETFNITSTAVDADGAQNVLTANGDAVTTINLSGNAGVALTSTAATLTTVDGSGLTGTTGTAPAGALTFTANNASMTVTGGAGDDAITIAATADSGTFNGGAGEDTFIIAAGADLITISGGAGADTFDFNGVSTNKSNFAVLDGADSGDTLDMAGILGGAGTFQAAQITLAQGATESTQAYLDQAMTQLGNDGIGWFQFNGNTYVTADVGGDSANAFADGTDFVTLITGLVDLSQASFNADSGTLEIA